MTTVAQGKGWGSRWGGALVLLALGLGLGGCEELLGPPQHFNGDSPPPGTPTLPVGQGVGQSCATLACRPGLDCVKNVCQPGHSLPEGSLCLIGAECETGLVCVAGTCARAGDGGLGDGCSTDLDCTSELRCGIVGLSTVCVAAGSGDLGASCATQSDCFQGLYCSGGECVPPEAPYGVPLWKGASCPKPNDDAVEALFAVPGGPNATGDDDFFRVPYPNDVRLNADGQPDLTDFPTPGAELLGVDMVAKYARAIEQHTHGFSTTPSIVFRFSGAIDAQSLKTPAGEVRRLVIVDLDDPTGDVDRLGFTWINGEGRTKYVCDDWLAVGVGRGGTLVPGHRHAVWLTTDVKSKKGAPVARAKDFSALLGAAVPGDAKLADAHAKYAPLRDYLSAHSIDPKTLLVATVFTTDDAVLPLRDLAARVAADTAPTVSDWTLCRKGVASPCPEGDGDRACGAGTKDYDEYQALVSLPIFQEGDAPYQSKGGAIASAVQRREDVCLALTVPKGAPPVGGWPLVVYAHGTGGSMRSHVIDAIAGRLARATPHFAVLGIDQVEHGPRRGTSTESPDNLFFNFLNPDAARGNPSQGAADQLSLYRLAQSLDVSAAESGGADIVIDPTRVLFYGHSQGSTHGSLALPFSAYPGAVLSGNGGALGLALLHKTNPRDIASGIPLALQDPDSAGNLAMGELNPALGLLQHYMDAADPLTFAPLVASRPEAGQTPKHVFETFGLGDTYSPPQTLSSYIYATGVMTLAPPPSGVDPKGDDLLSLPPSRVSSAPVSGNFGLGPTYTLVTRQYQPPKGTDGHHVTFNVSAAETDVVSFLETLSTGAPPTVPAP